MNQIKSFEKKKHFLDYEEIDSLHQEFLEIYNSVDMQSIKSIKERLTLLLEHTKRHFAQEEQLMDTYEYTTHKEHKDEHNKVLNEMQYFLDISHSVFGEKMLKAYYVEKIPYWFDLHLMSMDSDLTHFLKQHVKCA